jgi:aldehyde:ferredoxin oxidoreductase
MAKILRVNLSKGVANYENVKPDYKTLGGRGLTSKIISDEISPTCDPLSGENKLIFAPGIMAGTAFPNNGRLSVGAKSPLTQTIKESNMGGTAGQYLAKLGLKALIVEGVSDTFVYLKLSKGNVEILSADEVAGRGNLGTIGIFKEKYGELASILSIGQAGEKMLSAAAIAGTTPDFFPRMAARGGLGAVMGSKKLKAIVIDGSDGDGIEVSDPDKLKTASKSLSKGIMQHPLIPAFENLGTAFLVNMINGAGALPTKNFSKGKFENAAKISGEHMAEVLSKRPNAKMKHRCMSGCLLNCSNVYTDEKGEVVTSGLEYETLGLVGSNCMIDDLDIIAEIDRFCDDYGVDTMDVGNALAVAMESGQIPWGDAAKALEWVKEIGVGTKNGAMIGNGCRFTGETLGVKRIPVVKGQSISSYDPRVLKGTGVTYASSTMGADHTCGNALPSPANPDYNPSAPTGQGPVSKFLQAFFAAIDSIGMCLFASLPMLDMPELQKELISAVSAKLGEDLSDDYLMELGGMVMKIERQFNEAAGFSEKDDRLPDFFYEEKLEPSGGVFDVPQEEINAVYQ